MADSSMVGTVGVVVIGRNEGDRLVRCLASVVGAADRIVYVDSGSTDGSVPAAREAGAAVVELDMARPFTAARARNAGFDRLSADGAPDFVQFVDGDCEMRPGWITAAAGFLASRPDVAVVAGRLRERFPDASVYNRLCDREWDMPPGEARSVGGIAMMRAAAFEAAGGFCEDMIAGEEPELCVRLRLAGWRIWRLEDEMALHDAAMTRFGQWWRRARRGGHAYAERMALHGGAPVRDGVSQTVSALAWGVGLPAAALALAAAHPLWLLLLLAWPAQAVRLAVRNGGGRADWEIAFFTTLGKVPAALGALSFFSRRLRRGPARLIEYK